MSLIYIPPGHVWIIELAVAMARCCYPERWNPDIILPGEDEFWVAIIEGRYKAEGIHYNLVDRYRDVDWRKLSPQTCRFFAYDEALQVLRLFVAEGAIQAKFVDDDNQGAIDHVRSEAFRTDDGASIVCQGYACLADSPKKKRYIFVNEEEVFGLLRRSGALKWDPFEKSGQSPKGAESLSTYNNDGPKAATGGPKSRGIAEAVAALFPDGAPSGMAIKERDRRIVAWLRDNDYSLPDTRTIRRFFNQ